MNTDNEKMLKLPEAFVSRMEKMLGERSEQFFKAYNEGNHLSLRLNPLKSWGEAEDYMKSSEMAVPWEEMGYYYEEDKQPGKDPLHSAGAYYIQEASAMAPVHYLMKEPVADNERILDLCAAPGGKTTQIAGYMKNRGMLIANEIVPKRAKILSENIERMGVANALVISHDPRDIAERFANYFSRILVDAPCSGEGMFRKHPEAMEEWSPENVELCAQRQEWILDCAANMLMSGGTLVYSTCTFSYEENEGSIKSFLLRHPEFALADIKPEYGMVSGDENIGIRLFPDKLKGEGHFLAVLKKSGALHLPDIEKGYINNIMSTGQGASRQKGKTKKNVRDKAVSLQMDKSALLQEFVGDNMSSDIEQLLGEDYLNRLLSFGDNLYLAPRLLPDISRLKVERAGLMLGSFEKNRFEPSHAWAMALEPQKAVRCISLNREQAIAYLAGMTINLTGEAASDKGWCLLNYRGFSLGWGKIAGGIVKNHYPKGLRRA